MEDIGECLRPGNEFGYGRFSRGNSFNLNADLFINFTAVCDGKNKYSTGGVIDAVDHSPIADAVPQIARQFTFESFDVVPVTRIGFQSAEAASFDANGRSAAA